MHFCDYPESPGGRAAAMTVENGQPGSRISSVV